ncbi:MAG: 50S ribosomal protein L32 [Chlorobi bacterium]|nr:MAG: 50S ribosomal protein L32 [Chlorobi bacterium OLB7]MBK8912261.1 50S ribosomal protein L32 [Chlorobiota bacterium]MBX7215977.1 50S ribosomal protein L32 [Candidatus Kapabacteria bacterium]
MPNPKRKHSKSRRDKRRTHYKATAPAFGKCPNCGETKLHHTACAACGYYNGRVILNSSL